MKLLKSDRGGRHAFETDNKEYIWFKTKKEGTELLATCYREGKITLDKTIAVLNKIILLTHCPITENTGKPEYQLENEIAVLENISCMQKIIEIIKDKKDTEFPFLMNLSEKKCAIVQQGSFKIFETGQINFDIDFDLTGDYFKTSKIRKIQPSQAIKLITQLRKQE